MRSPRALFRRPVGRFAFVVGGLAVALVWSGPPARAASLSETEQAAVASPPGGTGLMEAVGAGVADHGRRSVSLDPRRDPENGFVWFSPVVERWRGSPLLEAGHDVVVPALGGL